MKCKSCGNELPDKARFCFECGTKVDNKIVCPSCSAELPIGAIFCFECGYKINTVDNRNKFNIDNIMNNIEFDESNSINNEFNEQKISDKNIIKSEPVQYVDVQPTVTRKDKVVVFLDDIKKCDDESKLIDTIESVCYKDWDEARDIVDNSHRLPIIIVDDIAYGTSLYIQDSLERVGCKVSIKVKK
jgi:ribosomal protein L40E